MRNKRLRWAIFFSVGGARKPRRRGPALAAGDVGTEQALVAVVGEAVVAAGCG